MASSRPRDGLGQFDENDQLPLKCMFCCTEKRLQTFHDVKVGDHIKQQGEQGSFNFSKKLAKFYSHHAIIKEVHEVIDNGHSAIITLIEFTASSFDPTVKIQERTVVKNLCYDETYLIKYRHKTHPPSEIIRRGQKLMNEELRYNLLFRNCEHVARWCICGNDTSFQAEGALEQINMFCRCFDNIRLKAVAMTVDDFLVSKGLPVLGSVALVVVILQQLLSCSTDTNVLCKLQENGGICESCCKKRKRELWAKFVVLLCLQTGGLIATSRIEKFGLQLLFGIFMSLLTTQVMRLIPKVYKDISSPFVGRKGHINSFHKITVGDVISWKTHGFFNDGIVTGVSILPNSHNKIADLRVIRYKVPGVFAKGIVVEETINIDIKRDQLRLHDYTGYDYNKPEIVIERARKRLGETKFGLTNRSAHFCHWAKMKDAKDSETDAYCSQAGTLKYLRPLDEEEKDLHLQPLDIDHRRTRPFVANIPIAINRPSASKEVAKEKVRIRDDIEPAQLIQFTFNHFPHQAVCTAVRCGVRPSEVILDIIHYGTSKVVSEETFKFDLNKVDIVIVKIHPIYKFSKNDIIRRAKAKLGQRGYNMLNHRSSNLAEEIMYKDIDRRVCSYSEVKPGDCINYKYWKLPHDAVVVVVEPLLAKKNDNGFITVVHYALDGIFATRYIKKEKVFFNLSEQSVVVKSFPGKVVYPDEVVVQRAISREGEQKFHIIGNISSDFVHWAKVVQTPCVVSLIPTDVSISPGDKKLRQKECLFLLLPRVGKSEEVHIQKDWIKTWDEVIPGIIVEKDGITGIVIEVHIADREVTLIHNEIIDSPERPETAVGMITKKTVKVDLYKEFLTIYRCDPRFANGFSVCVRKARQLLGVKVPGVGGLGFCKNCVVK